MSLIVQAWMNTNICLICLLQTFFSEHRRTKTQLKDLQRYRKNGIRKLTGNQLQMMLLTSLKLNFSIFILDCDEFESNLLLRDKRKEIVNKLVSMPVAIVYLKY